LNTLHGDNIDINAIIDDTVKQYLNDVYQREDINEILSCLDADVIKFSIRKNYNMLSFPTFNVIYEVIINDKMIIEPVSSDFRQLYKIYITNKSPIWLNLMNAEAREKITSKYLQYIMRLEDTIGLTYEEILNMEMKT
jgi:hypothetical protein